MKDFNNVDLGSIKIHKKVLAEVAYSAIEEIDGINPIPRSFIRSLADLLGATNYPGISVSIDKNNQVTIEVKIQVRYGISIPDIARQTQNIVQEAIEKTVDIDLKDVNVNIQGIERGKQ